MKRRSSILVLGIAAVFASTAFAQQSQPGATPGSTPSAAAADQAQPRQGGSEPQAARTPERAGGTNLSGARERLGVGVTDSSAAATTSPKSLTVSELEGREVRNFRGENLGNVHRVVTGPDGRPHIVISHGGLLGFGADRAAFPIERFRVDGDRLTVRGVTEQDIQAASSATDVDSWRRVDGNEAMQLGSVG